MSNDSSNEQGNATGAFQVGDRVRMTLGGVQCEGIVEGADPEDSEGVSVLDVTEGIYSYYLKRADLTLIARATPAPTRNSFAMTMPCQFGKHGECDGTLRVGNVATPDVVSSPCECECHQHSEPATPAPAQTAGIDAALEAFEKWDPMMEIWERPIVVCLCGSTRFSEAFRDANLRETLAGRIVLSIGCDMRSDAEIFVGMPQSELDDIKRRLDDLHKRKIDIADEILVLNVGGYIGESTASEIAYAKAHGKTIRYLETTGGLPTQPGETPDMAESTATEPATPAPAGYSSDDALYECPNLDCECPNLDCEMVAVTPLVRTSDGALCCPECKTELVQPATPAPAATAPALDTHTLALDFREDCSRCCGERGNGECPECDGDGFNIRTLRLSDEAVDRLAAALVKRMARDIRMIANDRP